MKRKILMLLFIFFSCNNNISNRAITINELLIKNGNRLFATHSLNGVIDEVRDKGKDSIIGGYYSFYNYGHLKSYQFFANVKTYGYDEEYDTKGDIVKILGDPFVPNSVRLITKDSIRFKTYFFSLGKVYNKINVITNDERSFNLGLEDDTLYSNMKVGSFGFGNLNKEKDIEAYLTVEYLNENNQIKSSFKDTIRLHYTP